MLTNSRIRSVIQKIIEMHGRCESIRLYKDRPSLESMLAKSPTKKKAVDETAGDAEEEEKKGPSKDKTKEEEKEPSKKQYVEYDNPSTMLFDIFGSYGCESRS